METAARNRWPRATLLAAASYAGVGITTAYLAGSASSVHLRTAWRLAAWLLSLVVFGAHLAYEHVRLGSRARTAAAHSAAAVALGAFALAVAGPVRSYWGTSGFGRLTMSLVLWPVLTGVPAFIVALVAGSILGRLEASRGSLPS